MKCENSEMMTEECIISESPMFTIEKLESIVAQMKKSVCKINNFISNCTGFFCKKKLDNDMEITLLISALHGIKDSKKLNLLLNNEIETKVINLDDSRIIYKDEKFDIVIIEIKPSDKINYSFLEIDEECSTKKDVNNYNNTLVYILGYPYGKDCTFSLGKMNVAETDNEKCIFHKCSSSTGSSGSPIILLENSKCIGIHLLGGKFKNGGNFLISSVNDFINEYKNKYSANTNEKNNLKDKQTFNNIDNQFNNNLNDNNIKGQYNQNINKNNNMNYQNNENMNNQNNNNSMNNQNINNNINNQYQKNRVINNNMNYKINQNLINENLNNQNNKNNINEQNMINNNMNAQNSQNINNNIMNNQNINNNMNIQNNNNMNYQNKNYMNYQNYNNNMNNLNNNNSMNNQNINNNLNNLNINNNMNNLNINNSMTNQNINNIMNNLNMDNSINNLNKNNSMNNIKNYLNNNLRNKFNDNMNNQYNKNLNNQYNNNMNNQYINNMSNQINNNFNNNNMNNQNNKNMNIQNNNEINNINLNNNIMNTNNQFANEYYVDIYPYINEIKINISFQNKDNEIKTVTIPASLRNSELYYTADILNNSLFLEYSDINLIKLFLNNQLIPNNNEPINKIVFNGANIFIMENIEDLSYYDSIIINNQNVNKINIYFDDNNGKKFSLIFPFNIKIKDMIHGFFAKNKIPILNRKYFSFYFNQKSLDLNEENLLINENIINGSTIYFISLDINKNSDNMTYLKINFPGKKLNVSLIDKNGELIGKIYASSLQRIKIFYKKLKNYLSQKKNIIFTGKAVILYSEIILNKLDERTFSSIGILNDFSIKLIE